MNRAIDEAYWAAAREDLLLGVGIPGDADAAWVLIVGLLSGAVGVFLLLPAPIWAVLELDGRLPLPELAEEVERLIAASDQT